MPEQVRKSMLDSSVEPIIADNNPTDPVDSANPQQRIAELERTIRELRDKEALFQLVLDAIPGRVFWKDKDLRFLGANHNFALDAQVEHPDQLIGKDDTQMVWSDVAELYRTDDRRVIESNRSKLNFEEPQITPDGEMWVLTSKVPLRDANGNVIGVLGHYDDITDRKHLEDERSELLNRTQRLLDLSHALTTVSDVASFIRVMYGVTEVPPALMTLLYIDSDEQGNPEYMTIVGRNDASVPHGTRFPLSTMPGAKAWTKHTSTPSLYPDVTNELQSAEFDETSRRLVVEGGYRAMAVVPLYQANRWVGVITYMWKEARQFTSYEQELFSQLPSLATPVAANLRTYAQLDESSQERALLLDRTQRLLNLSNTLTTVTNADSLIEIMYAVTDKPADLMTLQYIDNDEQGNPETLIIVAGNIPGVARGTALPLKSMGAAQLWINSPYTATLIADIYSEERFDEASRGLMLEGGYRAMAVVPLFQANRWIGTITYFWQASRDYTRYEYELFSQLPSLVTPVVANLRSIDQLETSLTERAALLDRTQKLLNISHLLTTVEDADALVDVLYNAAEIAPDHLTVNYFDNDAQGNPDTVTIVAGKGQSPHVNYGASMPLSSIPNFLFGLQAPHEATFVPDLLNAPGIVPEVGQFMVNAGQRAMAIIPLFQANRWVGSISYFWGEPHDFTIQERELFSQLPSLITPVVANLRSVEQLESSFEARASLLDRTERLLTLGHALTTITDVQSFVDVMASNSTADMSTMLYIDNDEAGQPEFMMPVAGSQADGQYGVMIPIKYTPSTRMWLADDSHPTLISDILAEDRFDEGSRQVLLGLGQRAMAVIPLFQAGRWIGVFTYCWAEPHEYTTDEREVFSQLPSLLTPVVANLRSIDQLEGSLSERALLLSRTERVLQVSRQLTTVSDKQAFVDIMHTVTEVPAELMTLQYIDNDEQGEPETMTLVAGSIPGMEFGLQLPLKTMPAAQTWINTPSRATLIEDVLKEEQFDEVSRTMMLDGGHRAMAVVPLFQAGRWIGSITYFWGDPHQYSSEERELFAQLPSLATPVVANLRAIEQLEQSLKELEVASAMARESNRLKSEFLATMSHELRTPMNAIEGFTSIMLSGMGGTEFNDATRKYLDRVNANSKRLLGLINDFLDLSRIESGRLKLVSNPLPLEQLALRWRDQVSVLAQNRGLEFSVEIADNLPKTVYGDEENISRIAINLLGNAIKFTEQGSVTMRLYSSGDNWALEVQDTGIGIPPHAREFIFDEFRQVDNSSKRQYGGSGLGLAIVQKLVRAMRGSILLKSEVGEGSTFTVLLPMQ